MLHQSERGRAERVAVADVVEHGQPQACGHLGIRQGAVKRAVVPDSAITHERSQLVVWRVLVQPPCDQHGAGEPVRDGFPDAGEFRREKASIERRIVRDDRMVTEKSRERAHHVLTRRSVGEHVVRNSGVIGNEVADRKARVHERLEALGEFTLADQNGADFDRAIAEIGRQAGGFEIEHDERIRAG